MKAVVATESGPGRVELRDVVEPVCDQESVILHVQAVGICGSDIHISHGNVSWDMDYPVTLGHEFAGVVAEVGDRVRGFAVGDRVVSETAAQIDTTREWYRRAAYNLDPQRRGFGACVNGGKAEQVAVPARCLHLLPETVSFKQGALIEPTCVAYQAACVQTTINPGDSVAVVGAGTIGLLCGWLATRCGAGEVVVVGLPRDRSRLKILEALGDIAFSDSVEGAEPLLEARGRAGADVVFDAAGTSSALSTAMQLARPGAQVTKVGWGPEPVGFSLDPIVEKQLTLRGSFSHTWNVWERVIGLFDQGWGHHVETIVGWEGPLSGWATGFRLQSDGVVVKAMLMPQSVEFPLPD